MSYNAKNYTEQGGEKTVINGVLEFGPEAEVKNFPGGGEVTGGLQTVSDPGDSTADSIESLVADYNNLLAAFRTAGIIKTS